MKENYGILMNCGFKNDSLRVVTHRDLSQDQMEKSIKLFKKELN
jgi:hypothetical protein